MDRSVIPVRTPGELALLRQSGRITALALKKVLENVREGVSLAALDKIAEEEIIKRGGRPSFKTVPGYHWASCLTVNDEVVHGIPRDITLKTGDILSVDLGTAYQGWHSDAAWTVLVNGQGTRGKKRFLKVGEEVLWKAIGQARLGKKIGDISSTIQKGVEGAGFSVVRSLAGHGVGRSPHEEPEIPEFGLPSTGPKIKKDMSLAIEVIYTAGTGEVMEKSDGWTIASADGSLGGLFEMSVITGKKEAEVITDWRKL